MNQTAIIAHFKDTVIVSDEGRLRWLEIVEEAGGITTFTADGPGFWVWSTLAFLPDISYARGPVKNTRKPEPLVYFIRAEKLGFIKIGVAIDLEPRLKALRAMSPDRLEVIGREGGGRAREAELHALFAAARSHGEWFFPTNDLLEYIARLEWNYDSF